MKHKESETRQALDRILREMERLRCERLNDFSTRPDFIFRLCEAVVAQEAGYADRMAWSHLQTHN